MFVSFQVHLNFLDGWGLYRAYPELAGIGDGALAGRYFAHKTGAQHRCPDASNPLLVTLLAEWMEEICTHFRPGGVNEICCWLTERPAEDGRPSTAAVGQFVLEARAFVAAWDGGSGPGAERVLLTSYFFDRAVEAGLATEGASDVTLAPRDFLSKASEACAADSVEALEAGGKVEAEHAPYFCMDLAFIYALLTEGFGVNAGSRVQAYKKFLYNGREFESAWPLGAALVTVVD